MSTRPERLVQILGRAGLEPDGDIARALAEKRVAIDGEAAWDETIRVAPTARLTVDGVEVDRAAPTRVLAFHKPAGLVSDPVDPRGVGTVDEAVRSRIHPELQKFRWLLVGRLDRASTGLILLTNDAAFVQHATAPTSKLAKRYVVTTDERVRDGVAEQLLAGVPIEDGEARAIAAERRDAHTLALTIEEGRHHQVRRMCNAVRLSVKALRREAIGGLELDLAEGGWRELSAEEIREKLRFESTRG